MIDRTVTTVIDRERCIGCGECVRVCPSQTIALQDGKVAVTGTRSLGCGHCAAVKTKRRMRKHVKRGERIPGGSEFVQSVLSAQNDRMQVRCLRESRG